MPLAQLLLLIISLSRHICREGVHRAVSLPAQHLADLMSEIGRRIRLLQPGASPKARNRRLGIARSEQDLKIRLRGERRLGQFIAIHSARHHNIGEEHCNRGMSGEQTEGSGAIFCLDGLIAEAPQPCCCDPTDANVIFDDKNGFRASRQGNCFGGART